MTTDTPIPPPDRLPDMLIVGDSHSSALADGAAAHGLSFEHLRLSGNYWHNGEVQFSSSHGFSSRRRFAQNEIARIRQALGGRRLIDPEVPVLATFGWHLGRMAPPFMLLGHVADQPTFEANPAAHFVSSAFVAAYAEARRDRLWRLAQRVARVAPLVMVVPPLPGRDGTIRAFRDVVTAALRRKGVTVVDPAVELLGGDGLLPPDWQTADRVHGNSAYGKALVGLLLEQGLVRRRS